MESTYESGDVYPVSEDTELLISGICDDIGSILTLVESTKRCSLLEIGCGSGQVLYETVSHLNKNNIKCIAYASDINSSASTATKSRLKSLCFDVLTADLVSCWSASHVQSVLNGFDVIIFNPPYVPTDRDEYENAITQKDISASWAGGKFGREVLQRLIPNLPTLMAEKSLLYLIVLYENDPKFITQLLQNVGFHSPKYLDSMVTGNEKLFVMRFQFQREENVVNQ